MDVCRAGAEINRGGRIGLLLVALLLSGVARAEELICFCATSAAEALEDVAAAFVAQGGARVVVAPGASSTLARQIQAGAPASLFLSADDAQMDAVERAGELEPGTRRPLVGNTLVVVALPEQVPRLHGPRDLMSVRRVALADPQGVPAGVYARAWLSRLGLWETLAARVVSAADVRAALAAVEVGGVDAAVVYATDARSAARAKIAFIVPPGEAPRIVYPVALLRKAGPAPRAFLAFLLGPKGREAFERRGFLWVAAR